MSDTSMEVLHGLKQTLDASATAGSNTIIRPKEAREAANAISDIEARAGADAEKRKREASSLFTQTLAAFNDACRQSMPKHNA